jgi:hypothetical protein
MSAHRCHCVEPATWMVRAVEPSGDARAISVWASCDDHLAEAARGVLADPRVIGRPHVLTLRAES